jgi:group I intron endonuclease
MVGIYKITNPEGKSYIGLSREIEVRWNSYKNMQFQSNTLLKESFKKYGYSNHIFEIIEEIELFEDTYGKNTALLRKRERYWILKFDTFYNGLNQNGGGSGCGSHTTESKQKISESLKGKLKPVDFGEKRKKWQHNEEWREKISKSLKGKSKGKGISKNKGRVSPNKGMIGKTRTEETKKLIGSKNSKIQLSKSKPIFQYDILGNFIQQFPSQKSALEFYRKPIKFSGISDCLNGRVKSSMGYIWKYEKV